MEWGLSWPLGGEHPSRRDDEFHGQADGDRQAQASHRARGFIKSAFHPKRDYLQELFSDRTFRTRQPDQNPLLRHVRGSDDLDEILDLHASLAERRQLSDA